MDAFEDLIRALPDALEASVAGLTDTQLDTPYREDGWTVRQVVHHVADSHINAYCRFRLALTEDNPTVRTYVEGEWARLEDGANAPIGVSLTLIRALHDRWSRLLDTLTLEHYQRPLYHPEIGDITLWNLLETYQWHGRHHVAHITTLREAKGW
jgi:hypothetical protein